MRHTSPLAIGLLIPLLGTACGGMSEMDTRDRDEDALAQSSEQDADEALEEAEAEMAEEEAAPESDEEEDSIVVNANTVIVIDEDDEDEDVVPSSPRGTAPTPASSPAPTPASGTATGRGTITTSDPDPVILGTYSEAAIPATPVAPETWVPAEGLAGLSESNIDLEIVDDLSVLIIFDNSGSMDTHWDGRTRWEMANLAVYEALAPVRTSLKVAAVRFPLEVDCGVPEFDSEAQFEWELAGDFLDHWIERAIAPAGGTPLAQAFIAADAAIADASEEGLLEDRFNVLVITDGEPNCASEQGLLTDLPAKWLERGVLTHVLGLPGSAQAEQLLNDIAVAGGTQAPVTLETPEELNDEVLVRTR